MEQLEERQLLSASKILFVVESYIGEEEWRAPARGEDVSPSSSWGPIQYNATYENAASGGSYSRTEGSILPFEASGTNEAYLSWVSTSSRLNLGWPGMGQSLSIRPYLDVPAGTPYSVSIDWGIDMENISQNPEHQFSHPGTILGHWSGTSTHIGRTDVYEGVTGGTTVMIEGRPVYALPAYGSSTTIRQNGSTAVATYTGHSVHEATVRVEIHQGDEPEVEIVAPSKTNRGEIAHLDSLAWDPDNGPKSDGNGITYYRWEITTPSGNTLVRDGGAYSSLDMAFEEVGKFDVKLTVYDDEGMSGATTTTLHIEPPVDLESGDSAWRFEGDIPFGSPRREMLPVNYAFEILSDIQNTGTEESGPFDVAFYLSQDGTHDNADFLLGTAQVASIAPGGSEVVTLVVLGGLEAALGIGNSVYANWYGNLSIIVVADSSDVVDEPREDNNSSVTTIQLADRVAERRGIGKDFTTQSEAARYLLGMGFRNVGDAARMLGDSGYYRNLPRTQSIVSPFDGVSRVGSAYREHAHIVRKQDGRWTITIQGAEPDPRFAVIGLPLTQRFPGFPPTGYVRRWHDLFT